MLKFTNWLWLLFIMLSVMGFYTTLFAIKVGIDSLKGSL